MTTHMTKHGMVDVEATTWVNERQETLSDGEPVTTWDSEDGTHARVDGVYKGQPYTVTGNIPSEEWWQRVAQEVDRIKRNQAARQAAKKGA
jgi:hypothetical protein